MKLHIRRTIAFVLCLMTIFAFLPMGEAEAATSYSMYSNKKVKLQIPGEQYLFDVPMTATIKGTTKGDSIYILPKPENGNGDMGTIKKDSRVAILAEKNGFYLFMTTSGKLGWNKTKYFTSPTVVIDYLPGISGISVDHLNTVLEFLRDNDNDKCGAASKDFYATRAVLVVDKGDSKTFTVHGKWYATYTETFYGSDIAAKWSGKFNRAHNCKIKVTGKYVGSGYIKLSNSKNSQSFYVLILVT